MAHNQDNPEDTVRQKPGLWSRLWRVPRKRYLLGIPVGALLTFVIGIAFTGTSLTVIEATNTLGFCTSCHEMEAFVYQEYQESIHYQNASGVRAICSDCHVPNGFFAKMLRKTQATFKELPAHFLGRIDTREKFEAHRMELAEDVWAAMREDNSRECRACHSYEAMAKEKQDRYAQRRHSQEYREATGKTCIDCHKGVAHKLPEVM